MFYTFLSSVFITLFFVIGFLALDEFLVRMRLRNAITWKDYQHVFVLALIAFLCFILAVIAGYQIPEPYAPTIL